MSAERRVHPTAMGVRPNHSGATPGLGKVYGTLSDAWLLYVRKLCDLLVPVERIELPPFGLQNRCPTADLNRPSHASDRRMLRLVLRGPWPRGKHAPSDTRVVGGPLQRDCPGSARAAGE